jgi:hypothetical protein
VCVRVFCMLKYLWVLCKNEVSHLETERGNLSAPNATASLRHAWLYECAFRSMRKKLKLSSDTKKCQKGHGNVYGGVWRSLLLTGVWNLTSGGWFGVGVSGTYLASVAVELFSCIIYSIKSFINLCVLKIWWCIKLYYCSIQKRSISIQHSLRCMRKYSLICQFFKIFTKYSAYNLSYARIWLSSEILHREVYSHRRQNLNSHLLKQLLCLTLQFTCS